MQLKIYLLAWLLCRSVTLACQNNVHAKFHFWVFNSQYKPLQMNISYFLRVWFPIWLRRDNSDIAVTHSLRSPSSISPNQISLVGLFIIASSDCEWRLANGFSIQICWLDVTESQQGLSFLRWPRLQNGVNKKEMTLLKYAFVAWLFLHLVRFVLILKVF